MPNAFVQDNSGTSTNLTSATITLASAPAAGDWLVLFVSAASATSTPTDSQGNTWHLAPGSFSANFSAYYTTSNGVAGAYTATVNWASTAGGKFYALGEWSTAAGFAFDSAKYVNDTTCSTSETFTAPAAGCLATLYAFNESGWLPAVTGSGVVERQSTTNFAMGDKLSTASGSNLWGIGGVACCTGTAFTASLVFKPTSSAPSSVISDAMDF